LGRLFEPFFTTKDVGKGTGLGLATAYGLIKQHHGWIEVESRPQHGATFRIFVPALNPEAVAAKAPQTMVASGGRETILVVEDEPHLRSMVREILETYGYGVLEAEDGPAALKTWQLGGKPIDLLLTDLVMPSGMSGEELAARLRQQQPSLKVVYTSGYSVELAGRGLGGQSDFHFLQKPYRPEILAKTIRECLDRPGKDAAGPAS
jgi:CheY-like chemotaxis protein